MAWNTNKMRHVVLCLLNLIYNCMSICLPWVLDLPIIYQGPAVMILETFCFLEENNMPSKLELRLKMGVDFSSNLQCNVNVLFCCISFFKQNCKSCYPVLANTDPPPFSQSLCLCQSLHGWWWSSSHCTLSETKYSPVSDRMMSSLSWCAA